MACAFTKQTMVYLSSDKEPTVEAFGNTLIIRNGEEKHDMGAVSTWEEIERIGLASNTQIFVDTRLLFTLTLKLPLEERLAQLKKDTATESKKITQASVKSGHSYTAYKTSHGVDWVAAIHEGTCEIL